MLRILKQLRRSTVISGNIRKYIPYAVGEIFLLVIGILIALQINNWNQDRIERKKEAILLKEIYSEFIFNKQELETTVKQYNRVLDRSKELIQLFPIDIQRVNKDSLAAYFRGIAFNGSFDMSRGSIESLKNTYSYEIISSEELRSLLVRIDELVADYAEREAQSIQFVEQSFLPYLDVRIPLPYGEGIKDDRVDLSFLTSIEFENLIKNRVGKINSFLRLADEDDQDLVRSINRIIELTAS